MGMGGSQRMPTDMPERGRSQVHILEVVCTHAAATGTLADFPPAALAAADRQLSTISAWVQHSAGGDGQV